MSKTALPRDPLLGLDDGILGRIMVIHTFGDYARFHPHLHAIVANGPFQPNGTFYCLPKRDLKPREGKIKAPEDGPVVMEDFDDGWPGYEEPVLVYH